jgi:lipopolysaccharide biosynthesis glycosyltransferase
MKDIKIFVSHRTDKESILIDNPLYVNIKCGAALSDKPSEMQGDDTGINISNKKEHLSELTVMYWAWKNIKADYYGLCHYRRYFSFSNEDLSEYIDNGIEPKGQGFLVADTITPETVIQFGLDEKSMRQEIEKSDIILRKPVNVKKLVGLDYNCARDGRSKNIALQNDKDVDLLLEIIKEKYPDYEKDAIDYYNGIYGQWFDCFIMKKEIFDPFCEWLFDILLELEKRINYDNYNYQQIRSAAFLSEDLFGIYFNRLERKKKYKITYKPLVLFNKPEKFECPKSLDEEINIAIAVNDNTINTMFVSLQSILDHSNKIRNYHIVIIVDKEYKELKKLDFLREKYKNVSIDILNPQRFFLERGMMSGKTGINEHIIWRYLRVLLPYYLYNFERVIYIEPSIILNHDIAELYDLDMEDNLVGGTADWITYGFINGANIEVKNYYENHPFINNPYELIDISVMQLNLEKIRKQYDLKTIIKEIIGFNYPDERDFIHYLTYGRYKKISGVWNVISLDAELGWALELTPHMYHSGYFREKKNPWAINYRGNIKPWEKRGCDLEEYFWIEARNSLVYEEIFRGILQQEEKSVESRKKIINKLFPRYSRRRVWASKIYRRIKA